MQRVLSEIQVQQVLQVLRVQVRPVQRVLSEIRVQQVQQVLREQVRPVQRVLSEIRVQQVLQVLRVQAPPVQRARTAQRERTGYTEPLLSGALQIPPLWRLMIHPHWQWAMD